MSIINDLITDRTQADQERVLELREKGLTGMTPAELAEFLAGMKGAYNATDLNRVKDAMEYIAERFRSYGVSITLKEVMIHHMVEVYMLDSFGEVILDDDGYETIDHIEEWDDTTWIEWDIPTPAQLNVYLRNLKTLRFTLTVLPTTPTVPPDMEGFTWQDANDIERILLDIDDMLNLTAQSFRRCGNPTTLGGARGLPTENCLQEITWAELDRKRWTWADWGKKTWFKLLFGIGS